MTQVGLYFFLSVSALWWSTSDFFHFFFFGNHFFYFAGEALTKKLYTRLGWNIYPLYLTCKTVTLCSETHTFLIMIIILLNKFGKKHFQWLPIKRAYLHTTVLLYTCNLTEACVRESIHGRRNDQHCSHKVVNKN